MAKGGVCALAVGKTGPIVNRRFLHDGCPSGGCAAMICHPRCPTGDEHDMGLSYGCRHAAGVPNLVETEVWTHHLSRSLCAPATIRYSDGQLKPMVTDSWRMI